MKEYRKIPSLKFMYEVSSTGVVRNVKSKKILRQRTTPTSDYLYIHASIKNKLIYRPVHRLVAECWIPIPQRYIDMGYTMENLVINHKDFNIQNNNANNLEWCTQKENIHYSIDAGHITTEALHKYYENHSGYWLGKHLNEDAKKKLSDSRKEYFLTHTSPMLGKSHSPEAIQKMKDNHLDYTGCKNPRAHKNKVKMVSLDGTEKVFDNVDEACTYISNLRNISPHTARNSIVRVCRKKRKVAYKSYWYFI